MIMGEKKTQNVLLMLKERVVSLAQAHKAVVKSSKEEIAAEKANSSQLQKQLDESKKEIDMLQMNLRTEMSKAMQYQAMANSDMGGAQQMGGYKGGSVSEAELESLHEELREAGKQISENKDTINKLELDIEIKKKMVQQLKRDLEDSTKSFEEKMEEQLNEIQEKTKSVDKYTQDLKMANEKMESLEGQCKDNISEIKNIKEEMESAIAEHKELIATLAIEKEDLFEITQEFDVISFEREVARIKNTMDALVKASDQVEIKTSLDIIKGLIKRGNNLFTNEHSKMSNLNLQVSEMEHLLKNNIYAHVA